MVAYVFPHNTVITNTVLMFVWEKQKRLYDSELLVKVSKAFLFDGPIKLSQHLCGIQYTPL